MTTDLATIDLGSTPFSWTTLKAISNTDMVPKGLRGNPEAMLAAVYLGRELGLGPMQSMQMLDVIDGRPSLSAELQTAMIRDAGHSMSLVELSDKVATVKGVRVDNRDEMQITFTMAMAERAGLASKRNWKSYPEAMLWARAVSMLARMLFADVFAATHVYTPDELGDDVGVPEIPEAEIVDEPPTHEPVGETSSVVPFSETGDAGGDQDQLEAALIDFIAYNPSNGTMTETEAQLRGACRIAEKLGIVYGRGEIDYLHTVLADAGVAHVSELKRAGLINLMESVRKHIGGKFPAYLEESRS